MAHNGWGEKSMGKALDILHNALSQVQVDGKLLLDHYFMMNIFSDLYEELPELKKYLEYEFEEKEGNVIGSSHDQQRILAMYEAVADLFWPTSQAKRETTDFCAELAVGVATTFLTQFESGVTANYLSKIDGIYSIKVLTDKEIEQSLGVRANNDASESNFATFTDILVKGGRIGLLEAAGVGHSRFNGNMKRSTAELVTGRKAKPNQDEVNSKLGLFHRIGEKLQNSLLSVCKKQASSTRKSFANALKMQRETRDAEKKAAMEAKLENVKEQHMTAIYFHQQYFSPRCW